MNISRPTHRRVRRDADEGWLGGTHPHVCGRERELSPAAIPVAHVHTSSWCELGEGSGLGGPSGPSHAESGPDDELRVGSFECDDFSPVTGGFECVAALEQQRPAGSAEGLGGDERLAGGDNPTAGSSGVKSIDRRRGIRSGYLPIALALAASVLGVAVIGWLRIGNGADRPSVHTSVIARPRFGSHQAVKRFGGASALATAGRRWIGSRHSASPAWRSRAPRREPQASLRRPRPTLTSSGAKSKSPAESDGSPVDSSESVAEQTEPNLGVPSAQVEFGFEQ